MKKNFRHILPRLGCGFLSVARVSPVFVLICFSSNTLFWQKTHHHIFFTFNTFTQSNPSYTYLSSGTPIRILHWVQALRRTGCMSSYTCLRNYGYFKRSSRRRRTGSASQHFRSDVWYATYCAGQDVRYRTPASVVTVASIGVADGAGREVHRNTSSPGVWHAMRTIIGPRQSCGHIEVYIIGPPPCP